MTSRESKFVHQKSSQNLGKRTPIQYEEPQPGKRVAFIARPKKAVKVVKCVKEKERSGLYRCYA